MIDETSGFGARVARHHNIGRNPKDALNFRGDLAQRFSVPVRIRISAVHPL